EVREKTWIFGRSVAITRNIGESNRVDCQVSVGPNPQPQEILIVHDSERRKRLVPVFSEYVEADQQVYPHNCRRDKAAQHANLYDKPWARVSVGSPKRKTDGQDNNPYSLRECMESAG